MTAHDVEVVCEDHPGLGPAPHDEYEWAKHYECSGETIPRCRACGQLGPSMGAECHVGGVAIEDWRRVEALARDMAIDAWSATMRPGAWEYHDSRGEPLRRKLASMGYVEEPDLPDRPMGSRWLHTKQVEEVFG